MAEQSSDAKAQAAEAVSKDDKIAEFVEELQGSSRRSRQQAAAVLAQIAQIDPEKIQPYANDLVDALNRPEARTRWEALDALTQLVPIESRTCDKAIPGAEAALFDEDSGPLRLSAMRFLCTLGATTENRSEKIWPYINEGIQCYHGDLEFNDMLASVIEFSAGKLAPEVKTALGERMAFDATNGKGQLQKKAQAIVNNVK